MNGYPTIEKTVAVNEIFASLLGKLDISDFPTIFPDAKYTDRGYEIMNVAFPAGMRAVIVAFRGRDRVFFRARWYDGKGRLVYDAIENPAEAHDRIDDEEGFSLYGDGVKTHFLRFVGKKDEFEPRLDRVELILKQRLESELDVERKLSHVQSDTTASGDIVFYEDFREKEGIIHEARR